MEKRIGYHAINKGEDHLVVRNRAGNEVVGTICPNEKFVVIDSWVSNDNKYVNAKVKFVDYNGEFVYGYLYDVSYVKQVSCWSEWDFGSLNVATKGKCHIFNISSETKLYDKEGTFVKSLNGTYTVASFKCENHPTKEQLMDVDYIKCNYDNGGQWVKFQGFIDTKVNVNPFVTPVYGRD